MNQDQQQYLNPVLDDSFYGVKQLLSPKSLGTQAQIQQLSKSAQQQFDSQKSLYYYPGINPPQIPQQLQFQTQKPPEVATGHHVQGTKVFINNIDRSTSQEEIFQYFSSFGKINDFKLFNKQEHTYAYVIYENFNDALTVASKVTHSHSNKNWIVSLAKSKNNAMQYQQNNMNNNSSQYDNMKFFFQQNAALNSLNSGLDFSRFDQTQQLQQSVQGIIQQNMPFNYFNSQAQLNNSVIESLNNGDRSQINQTMLVREIWISNLSYKQKFKIKDILSTNFGGVEEVEFFDRGYQCFAFVKFYTVKSAYLAFSNKEKIAKLLSTDFVKCTYSDPSRRKGIIGDNENYMEDQNLSPVLYISFPYGFKVNKLVIQKIVSEYGSVINLTVKRSEDPKQTSSVLIEFKDVIQTKLAYKNIKKNGAMSQQCDFAVLLNSEKFIKENNIKIKNKYGNIITAIEDQKAFSPNQDNQENKDDSPNPKEFKIIQNSGGNNDMVVIHNDDDDDDDDNYVWSGFISAKKIKCGMDAKIIEQIGEIELEAHNFIINVKCPLQEVLKYPYYAIIVFKPSNPTNVKQFQEMQYFLNSTPCEAAVVTTATLTLYLLPAGREQQRLYNYKKSKHFIVALCFNNEKLKDMKNKKEAKYEDKLLSKNKNQEQKQNDKKASQDQPESEEIYDPNKVSIDENYRKVNDLTCLVYENN